MPTRANLPRTALMMVGGAGLVIGWIDVFWR